MTGITHFLAIVLSLIILFMGGFLCLHFNKPFLSLHPEKDKGLKIATSTIGILLVISGIATLITSFMTSLLPFIGMIVIDVILAMIITFVFLIFLFTQK